MVSRVHCAKTKQKEAITNWTSLLDCNRKKKNPKSNPCQINEKEMDASSSESQVGSPNAS